MNEKLELRMYGLVPYNISPIQQAIQFGHAVVEYGQLVKQSIVIPPMATNALEVYDDWANNCKTFIILNGGTSNHSQNRYNEGEFIGSMETHLQTLQDNGVDLATFYEPDLNDMLSAIVFIVDERVFNKKDYPDFENWVIENYGDLIRSDYPTASYMLARQIKESTSKEDQKVYQEWVRLIGGEKNVFLREFLDPKNFKLA
jgi:hypothetical protein